MQSLASLVPNP